MIRQKGIRLVIWLVLVTAAGGGSAPGQESIYRPLDQNQPPLTHRKGRVAANLHPGGRLEECERDGRRLGLRWPGTEGTEFLGRGGVVLRFEYGGSPEKFLLNPWSFEAVDIGAGENPLFEGCPAGKRYPGAHADDDGDGMVNEDPIDGIDNDGDDLVDEDFAAAGDEMQVTRALAVQARLALTQRSYSWVYGHVRDFIGFTTQLEYRGEGEDRSPDIVNLEPAIFLDLCIGEPGQETRGRDDRFFFLEAEKSGFTGMERGGGRPFVAAGDAHSGSPLAAVVIFAAEVVGKEQLSAQALIV
ncbi:MAG: hypothetical protein JXB45_02110, partial [Candidatus Krumholzibacteriota bacterium]|nr:hypothetical protein [Candidatus Krumholzibacteriota bacterium]